VSGHDSSSEALVSAALMRNELALRDVRQRLARIETRLDSLGAAAVVPPAAPVRRPAAGSLRGAVAGLVADLETAVRFNSRAHD
jgi:hypothetical protein